MDPKNKTISIRPCNFCRRLMHQIIMSFGCVGLPFMQNALCVAEATINIAAVPFFVLIHNTNPDLTLPLSVTHN